ncbi:MAG TPA: sigma-70 family RNA polymerase sigma factor [Gemmataceae bacterium]|jgi:RNA polymerase sigma-70 factor (ECF subfamily)|nr:sigma-70 family RNA polymerase sigma factor [Gemmataceae bacterium]
MDPSLRTASLHDLIDRHRAGDRRALDTLIRRTEHRLVRLARKMFGTFPSVQGSVQLEDVIQNALIRLTRALRVATPSSVRDYYRLAAEQLRRELLDLVRGLDRRPTVPLSDSDLPDPAGERVADLELWAALQEAVVRLPAEPREVFCLVFYHGWKQADIADLLRVSTRQVRREWVAACQLLHRALGGRLPP